MLVRQVFNILNKPSFAYLLKHPIEMLAFGFGSGLAPKAPGTFGTLIAIPFYFLIKDLSWPWYITFVAVTFLVGVYLCEVAAKSQQCHDHPGIVWDEMVGYWLTMFLAPPGIVWWVVGFVLFRIFDIFKPWPIAWFDRQIEGGFGIMFDDVLAAIYAFIGLQAIALAWAHFL